MRHWQHHMEKVFETHVKGRKHKNWEKNFNPANNDVNQQETQATCEARTGILFWVHHSLSIHTFFSLWNLPFYQLCPWAMNITKRNLLQAHLNIQESTCTSWLILYKLAFYLILFNVGCIKLNCSLCECWLKILHSLIVIFQYKVTQYFWFPVSELFTKVSVNNSESWHRWKRRRWTFGNFKKVIVSLSHHQQFFDTD